MDKTALTLYSITLVLSLLLFGAVHTYAYTIMSLSIFIGTLMLLKTNIKKDIKSGISYLYFPKNNLNLAFVALLTFMIIQIIPLPSPLLIFLSPEAMVAGEKSLSAVQAISPENLISQWFSISPYYYPVRMSIIRFTVYILFFLGLSQLLNSRKRIELTITLILLTGCFEALYGLAQTYPGSGYIWWFKKIGNSKSVTGTYINRNHFAGLMEICLLLAAAYVGALSDNRKNRKITSYYKPSLRVRISRFLSGEQRFNKRTLVLFAGAIMGIGLVFSASRAGIISAAGAMLCMGLFFIFRKNYRRKGLIILFLFLVTSVYALHIGADYPVERFKYFDLGIKERARLTQKTIDLFNDYRLTGVGVGNFQYAYPKYQSAEDKKSFIRHAHNDWAQFLAEGGIAGFSILLIALFYYIFRTIKFWVKRTDPFAICLGITPLVVITAIAIHSYFDFNLHIPANCMMLTAIMAIGHSALYLEKHRGRDKTSYHYHAMPLRYKGFLALLFVLSFIIWNGSWAIRHFIAEAYCNTVTNSTLNRDQNPALGEINKAIEWDRWNAAYWYKRAHELMRIRNAETVNLEDDEYKIKRQMEIISALEQAVSLNPFRAEYHMTLGWEYVYLWKAPDYYVKWLPAADISMERAAYFAGEKSPYLHLTLGNYWIFRSKTITPSRAQWETAWGKAIRHYKKAQSLERSKIFADKILQYVWKYYPDREYVRKTLLKENQILLDPI